MRRDLLTALALLLLAAGMAGNAILGPLVLGVIEFRISDTMENQLIGGEVVSLLAAAPLAVAAAVLWLRGHRLAPALALGPALYAVYMYFQFIVGPDYHRYDGNNERAFPLYLLLIVLGWAVAFRAWTALQDVRVSVLPAGLRRSFTAALFVLSTAIGLAWIVGIADVLDGGTLASEYESDPTLFWLVKTMDLAFVLPAALITGVGLLSRAHWATRLLFAVAGFQTLLIGAVAGMAIVMTLRDDPAADPVLLAVSTLFTLILTALDIGLLRHLARRLVDDQVSPPSGVPAALLAAAHATHVWSWRGTPTTPRR